MNTRESYSIPTKRQRRIDSKFCWQKSATIIAIVARVYAMMLIANALEAFILQ